MKTSVARTDDEELAPAQRWGELLIVVAMLVLFGFLAYHQFTQTGFFTDAFGPVEMLALYGPILVSFAAPIVRALNGHPNPARPFDVATNLSLALGSLWLFIVFPFDFTHLADALPGVLRLVLSWVTNDLGKVLLMLQVIIGPIAALVTLFKYLAVQRHEPAHQSL